jgi:hypothetical protein
VEDKCMKDLGSVEDESGDGDDAAAEENTE